MKPTYLVTLDVLRVVKLEVAADSPEEAQKAAAEIYEDFGPPKGAVFSESIIPTNWEATGDSHV